MLGSTAVSVGGSRKANPFVSGSPTTPLIAGLAGGAEVYGLVQGSLLTTLAADTLVKSAAINAPTGALVAVVREHMPAGFADYTGFDMVLYVNLTGVTLANPAAGVTLGIANASFQPTLKTGGLFVDPTFGGSGTPQTITGLAQNAIWVTLVPNSSSAFVNATVGGGAVNAIVGQSLAINNVLYVTAQKPAQTVGAVIPGLQNVAVSPDGNFLFAVNSSQNTLVVANASDLTQRQTFKDGVAGVTGLSGASAVVESPDGKFVYVGGAGSKQVAVFKVDPTTHNLSFVTATATHHRRVPVPRHQPRRHPALRGRQSGREVLHAQRHHRRPHRARLRDHGVEQSGRQPRQRPGLRREPDQQHLARPEQHDPRDDPAVHLQHRVRRPGRRRAVAVSPDDQYVYVIGEDGGTLAVFQRDTGNNSSPLTRLQVLQEGVAGVRGLLDADGVAVSPDKQFVYVTGGQGGTLTVFERQADGTLLLDQVLRGNQGLTQPAALAVASAGTIFVASQAGTGLQSGGLASFNPIPNAAQSPPHSFTITHSSIETLNVTTGASDDFITEPHPATVTTLTINAGDGSNTVSIGDFAGTTTVNTGAGPDSVTVRSAGSKTGGTKLIVNTGDGVDSALLEGTSAGDNVAINLGNGNDTLQVAGLALSAAATVTADGGRKPARTRCCSTPRATRSPRALSRSRTARSRSPAAVTGSSHIRTSRAYPDSSAPSSVPAGRTRSRRAAPHPFISAAPPRRPPARRSRASSGTSTATASTATPRD